MTLTTENPAIAAPRFAATSQLLRGFLNRLQAWKSLSPLSDAHLRDIGLIRHDIEAARRFPLSADVSAHLSIRAGMRAGNW